MITWRAEFPVAKLWASIAATSTKCYTWASTSPRYEAAALRIVAQSDRCPQSRSTLGKRLTRLSWHRPHMADSVAKLEGRSGRTRLGWRAYSERQPVQPRTGFQLARAGVGVGISLASFLRFCAVVARRNSSRAPFGPRSLSRSRRRMRFRCANRLSTFLRCRRETRPALLCPLWRACPAPPRRESAAPCARVPWGSSEV